MFFSVYTGAIFFILTHIIQIPLHILHSKYYQIHSSEYFVNESLSIDDSPRHYYTLLKLRYSTPTRVYHLKGIRKTNNKLIVCFYVKILLYLDK